MMSLQTRLSPECVAPSPFFDETQFHRLSTEILSPARHIDITYIASKGAAGALERLGEIRVESETATKAGCVVVSDRGLSTDRAALPAMLAASTVCKSLSRAGGWSIPVIIETGQVFDTHHAAMLPERGRDVNSQF